MNKKPLIVKCPQCEEEFEYYSSEFRPFCCEACQKRDLGAWFIGEYSIAGAPAKLNHDNEDEDEIISH